MGFYCVDNLPVELIPHFLRKFASGRCESEFQPGGVAGGMLVKGYCNCRKIAGLAETFCAKDHAISLVFIEANDDALLRRYSETRRPHPLGKDISGAREEFAVRSATWIGAHPQTGRCVVIDSTQFNVSRTAQLHQTGDSKSVDRSPPIAHFGGQLRLTSMACQLMRDLIFDSCAFLPIPIFVPGLKKFTGRDAKVRQIHSFVFRRTGEFLCRGALEKACWPI